MIDINQFENILTYCSENNAKEYNINKALEEAIEFQEVLIKLQTKHPTNRNRPTPEESIKEFGDVIYRGLISLKTIFPNLTFQEITEKISNHTTKKLEKLSDYLTEGKYKGGL